MSGKESTGKNVKKEYPVPLTAFKAGEGGVIAFMNVQNHRERQRLKAFGLVPGACVVVERVSPVLALRLKYCHIFLDREPAERIFMIPEPASFCRKQPLSTISLKHLWKGKSFRPF